jgi:hypothetical protein
MFSSVTFFFKGKRVTYILFTALIALEHQFCDGARVKTVIVIVSVSETV